MIDRIRKIQNAVEKTADCPASHLETVAVVDTFRGQTMWEGMVEIFTLLEHATAKRAYAWSTGKGADEQFTAVLEIPPVHDALTAVRASIVAAKMKNAKSSEKI